MGVKINSLPPIAAPALSDVFPVVQSGVTYKETITQLSTLLSTVSANFPVNTNITSMTGLTGVLQAPTFINDANANHVLGFSGQANAVNYLTLLNASTGNAPIFLSVGTDTNVGQIFQAQADGEFVYNTTASSNVFVYNTGNLNQHSSTFTFANTAATDNYTWPDLSGSILVASKVNGTEAANAVTASGTAGVITTSSLTTASGSSYAITWTNTLISTSSVILLSIMGGTNTKNSLELIATAGSGTSTLTITNNNSASLDGTVIIGYQVIP